MDEQKSQIRYDNRTARRKRFGKSILYLLTSATLLTGGYFMNNGIEYLRERKHAKEVADIDYKVNKNTYMFDSNRNKFIDKKITDGKVQNKIIITMPDGTVAEMGDEKADSTLDYLVIREKGHPFKRELIRGNNPVGKDVIDSLQIKMDSLNFRRYFFEKQRLLGMFK